MTCIVGIVRDGVVHIAGDSASTDQFGGSFLTKTPKVFLTGEYLIGYTSSFRMGQLLQYSLVVPERNPQVSAYEHMVTAFIPAVRKVFEDGGYIWKENDMTLGGEFLVGYDGQLFHIQSSFQVLEHERPFDSCGSGRDIAMGSLHSTTGNPTTRLLMALEAAAEFDSGVRAPFLLLSQEAKEKPSVPCGWYSKGEGFRVVDFGGYP